MQNQLRNLVGLPQLQVGEIKQESNASPSVRNLAEKIVMEEAVKNGGSADVVSSIPSGRRVYPPNNMNAREFRVRINQLLIKSAERARKAAIAQQKAAAAPAPAPAPAPVAAAATTDAELEAALANAERQKQQPQQPPQPQVDLPGDAPVTDQLLGVIADEIKTQNEKINAQLAAKAVPVDGNVTRTDPTPFSLGSASADATDEYAIYVAPEFDEELRIIEETSAFEPRRSFDGDVPYPPFRGYTGPRNYLYYEETQPDEGPPYRPPSPAREVYPDR